MAEAGWYTDPYDSARLRYWDGAQWTQDTHDRPPEQPVPESPPDTLVRPPDAPDMPVAPAAAMAANAVPDRSPEANEPPFTPAPEPEPGTPTARPGHLNDIGEWLRRTFRVGLAKLLPCGLLILLGLIPAVFVYGVGFLALSEVTDGGGLEGAGVVMFLLVGLLFMLWMLWTGVITLAQNHLLYQAHIGRPTSIGQSVQAGIEGLGRLVWAYLTLLVYVIMLIAIVGGLTFLLSFLSDTIGSVFFVVAYIVAMALSVWLSVKLIFLVVAAAVAPPGSRPMVVSVETTDGYFWAVLGRSLLLGLIMTAALLPVMLVFGGVIGALGVSAFNDPGSGTATALIAAIGVGAVLYLVAALATQVFSTSGIVRLYVDLGGPARHDQPVAL